MVSQKIANDMKHDFTYFSIRTILPWGWTIYFNHVNLSYSVTNHDDKLMFNLDKYTYLSTEELKKDLIEQLKICQLLGQCDLNDDILALAS